jgi:hypothetical protein
MSLVKVSGNASGTGTLTIAAPNTNTDYTLTLPAQTGILVAGTTTAGVLAPAGTATLAPMLLTSGTNLTSATAGAIEYDGKVVYGTPIGTQRGIVPTQQYYRLNSTYAGADSTSSQSIFGVGVTLSASTVYEFEYSAILTKTAGTTSHTFSILFGGTATLNNLFYVGTTANKDSSVPPFITTTSLNAIASNSAAALTLVTGITSATESIFLVIKGTVSINAGGTFIPQYTLSAAPGGAYTTQIGSYIKINPLGASGANTSVGTWA